MIGRWSPSSRLRLRRSRGTVPRLTSSGMVAVQRQTAAAGEQDSGSARWGEPAPRRRPRLRCHRAGGAVADTGVKPSRSSRT
jgi:hypothetical protein